MTGRTEHMERELKLAATPELELPPLQGLTNAVPLLPAQQLRAIYFDTPDFRLFDRRMTFRHRTGEESGDGVWTIKVSSNTHRGALQRTEISWRGSEATIPAESRRILRGIVRHSELRPLVIISTTRHRFALRGADGSTWAELDDDSVSVSGGPEDGLRFRQLELELTSGKHRSPPRFDLINEVVRQFQEAGASPETESKLAKALGSPVALGPMSGDGSRLGTQATMADLVRANIASSLDRILNHDVLLRLQPPEPEPEDVHKTRVAIRRLRSDLKTFATVLDPVWVGHVRADLRWAGTILGKVRDADVLMDRLELGNSDPDRDDAGRHQLRERLTKQRRQAAQDVGVAPVDERYLHLLDRLHAASTHPPFFGHQAGDDGLMVEPEDLARSAVRGPVARSWRPLKKRARKRASSRNYPSDGDLHEVRIKAKRVRYASEAAASVAGTPAQRTARAAKKLQTVLGAHHDAVTAEAWLATEAHRSTPAASYTAGLLAGEQRRLQKELRRAWKPVWHDLAASTGWLRPT